MTTVIEDIHANAVADFREASTALEGLSEAVADLPLSLAERAKTNKALRSAQTQVESALVTVSGALT